MVFAARARQGRSEFGIRKSAAHRTNAAHSPKHALQKTACRLAGRFSIGVGPKEMERNVRFVADDPAVVWDGRNVKKLAGVQLKNAPVIQCRGRDAGKD